jgi:hypothetical protein
MTETTTSHTLTAALGPDGHSFAYEACDIEPDMTIAEYRRSRWAGRHRPGLAARLATLAGLARPAVSASV